MNFRRHAIVGLICALAVLGSMATPVLADVGASSAPSKRQLMKECMAKQKASDSGMPKEQMKKNCRDVVSMKSENTAAEKQAAKAPEAPSP